MYWAFYHPVSTKEFKSYPKVVSDPKCLEDIVTAIRSNNYETCDAFLSDVMLISSNCEAFSRSGYISYNNDLVLIGWGLFVRVTGCFFNKSPSAIALLDSRQWSVQQRALFKIHALDFKEQSFIFRVDAGGFPQYYKLVKKPMSLSEVQMHAASSGSSVDSVVEKVRLMCSNCRLFCSSAHGAEFSYLLPKVDMFLEAVGSLGRPASTPTFSPAPTPTAPSPAATTPAAPSGMFRIRSSGSASASIVGKSPPASAVSDAVRSSDAAASTATFGAASRAVISEPTASLSYYLEQLAELFPNFVPEVKQIMDAASYKIYKQTVKQPMSISTMRSKIKDGAYSSMQFLADVQLIGSNCVSFWTGHNDGLVAEAYAFMQKVCVICDVWRGAWGV